ncbi:hypothetical protein T4B_2425 [Trichinella pseudospiralis]|uniref:Uncharacterized protein n=1 Tax=Trichinella pseudospiralis TaxID=6337 RepID=A0A0V1IH58_TRIPS|nr:hypothetical protein T4B_2425 [Trichinella pseudospiralis]
MLKLLCRASRRTAQSSFRQSPVRRRETNFSDRLPSEKSFDLNFDGSDVVVRISASAGNDSHSKSETVQWARCEPGKICKTKKQPSRRRRSECGARFCPMLGIMNDKQNGSTFLCSLTSVWEAELLSVGSLF